MNEVQLFKNQEFGSVRTLVIDNEPWFVGKDVAEALGYEKPTDTVRKRVDEYDRGISKMETPSGKQNMVIINESGLYSLVLSSKLPSAKKFKRWVIEEMKPKALFADAVATSHTSILVGELAKILKQNGIEMGQKRLFAWLREKGYLIKRQGTDYNMPTQKSMDLGLFEIKEGSYVNGSGVNITTKTPKVTGKGQQYFINKFLAKE